MKDVLTVTPAHLAVLRKVADGQVGWHPKLKGFVRLVGDRHVQYRPTPSEIAEGTRLWELHRHGYIAPGPSPTGDLITPHPVRLTGRGSAELNVSAPITQDRRPA